MGHGITDLVVFGLVAVVIGVMTLLGMVHFELGPAARLAGRKRWLLGLGLGSGVLAFAIKLMVIITLVNFPQYTIQPLLTHTETAFTKSLPALNTAPRYTWLSLADEMPGRRIEFPDNTPVNYTWQSLPDRAPAPANNPTTAEKIELGKRLFFDRNLSLDRSLSCASCHDIEGLAGADGRAVAVGVNNRVGHRNTPSVWNTAFQSVMFWDGRAASLEQQVSGPLLNPVEMAMPSQEAVVLRVMEQESYRKAFADIFGKDKNIEFEQVAQALAAYERSLITPDTPYDRFVRGDHKALSDAQLRGMNLFQSLGCINCHHGPNFSAASVFDARTPMRIFPVHPTPYEQQYHLLDDAGAASVKQGRGVWRVPSLRNVALTGPWLHNGSVTELHEVVRIMAAAQLGYTGHHLLWSEQTHSLREIRQPELDEQSIDDVVAFLHALSSDVLVARYKSRNSPHL